eukprot:m.48628 g.48628  ORF g.48628 m.48628 type:complete len:102 (+) comp10575_c0_seq2:288-593(+)
MAYSPVLNPLTQVLLLYATVTLSCGPGTPQQNQEAITLTLPDIDQETFSEISASFLSGLDAMVAGDAQMNTILIPKARSLFTMAGSQVNCLIPYCHKVKSL